MPSRRETFIHDKMRNSAARKKTAKDLLVRQKQQATVLEQLVRQAKAAAKSA